jgi:3-phenylpropionate/trans-cinnamate dioxygenase ferredoxin reductase subunit
MSSACRVSINGRIISAAPGATLLDAALSAGIPMPHDCCTGQCDTCRVTVTAGVDDAGTREGDTVLACQATLLSDAIVRYEEVPAVAKRRARVVTIRPLSPEISELVVELDKPLRFLPGQYVKLSTKDLPERDYSPTFGLDGEADEMRLSFHIRRYAGGRFSSELGRSLRPGARLIVRGPFGHAWLRQGRGPLVLVASGTGFAPIWAIAVAARMGQPDRPMTVICGARNPSDLYMRDAFAWLAKRGVGDLNLTCSGPGPSPMDVRRGRPTDWLPTLGPRHAVYAAGAPAMVSAVKHVAALAGAECHADPFTVSQTGPTLKQRIGRLFSLSRNRPVAMNEDSKTFAGRPEPGQRDRVRFDMGSEHPV